MKLVNFLLLSLLFVSSYAYADRSFMSTDFWKSMECGQVRPTQEELLSDPVFFQLREIYEVFSKQVKEGGFNEYSIPKVIHFIWLGSEVPAEALVSIDSWRKHHPDWEIKVWKDEDLESFEWTSKRARKNFLESGSFAEKADILRCEILYQFGGIYSDTDVICLKPFHDLVTSNLQFFGGIEVNLISRITKNPLHMGTAIMGAAKGSQTMKYFIDHHLGLSEAPDEHILNRTGPGLCSRSAVHTLKEKKENILLLPISYFYPFPLEHRHLSFEKAMTYQAPETMAIHLWRASWLSKEDLERMKQHSINSGFIGVEEE